MRQNTADETAAARGGYLDDIRVVKQRVERERRHIDALRQHLTQRIALIALHIRAAFHEYLAIAVHNILRQRRQVRTGYRAQLFSQLKASRLCQIVTARIKELRVHQRNRTIQRRNLIAALILIHRQQRLLRRLDLIA